MATYTPPKAIPKANCSLDYCKEEWQRIRYIANIYFSIVDNSRPSEAEFIKLMDSDLSKEDGLESYIFSPFIIASAVNMSFAIELGLKTILSKNKIAFKKIHKLNKLYELLPGEVKASFFNSSRILFNLSNEVLTAYVKRKKTIPENVASVGVLGNYDDALWKNLHMLQNIYTEFRYIFEEKNKEKIKSVFDSISTFWEMYSDVRDFVNFKLDNL